MSCAERVRVGDVLHLERRAVLVDPVVDYAEIGVRSFGRGIFHKEPIEGAALGSKRVFRIEPGDLVISNVFAWEGAIAVASAAEAGRIGSHRFMTYVPSDARIDPGWVAWYLLSEPGHELIRKASPGSAGRNKTLAVNRFEDLVIPLPPINEQLDQAAYLDCVREQTGAASRVLADHSSDTFVTALPPLVDQVVGRASSHHALVGDLMELVSDTVQPGDSPGEAQSFVGLQHIERHTGRRIGADPIESMKGRKFRFRPGDVIYGYLRPYLNKAWAADRHGLCSVDQYVLRPKPTVAPEVIAYVLRGQAVLDKAITLTHSLQLPRLRSGLLMSLEVPVVAGPEVANVLSRLDVLRDRVVAIAALRDRQLRAADALVPAALNGVFGCR